jgi:hypothetical protein
MAPYGDDIMMKKAMEVLLTRHKFNCQLEFPLDHGIADNATFHYMIDHASNSFRVAMRNYMYQGAKGVETFHQVPATWWDHFKQTHFPHWALDRWPVKYTRLCQTTTTLCPHGADQWPHANHIRFLYLGDERHVSK